MKINDKILEVIKFLEMGFSASIVDKNDFYDFELNNRRQQNLPPFSQMARFEISSLDENLAKNFAKNFLKLFPVNDKIDLFFIVFISSLL